MKILITLLVHESNECIIDLIDNINKFVEDPIIVLHVNPEFTSFEIPKYNNVYINPERFIFILYDTIIGHHYSNINYILSLGITFEYVIFMSSNVLFIRKNLENHIKNYDAGFFNTRPYHKVNMQYNFINYKNTLKKIRKKIPALGDFQYISNIEGTFMNMSIYLQIYEILKDIYLPWEYNDTHQEEFVFPLLLSYFTNNLSNGICYIDLDKNKLNIDDINNILENPNYYCVKRICRDINDTARQYIKKLSI
jgi:hypothetical protein